MTRDLGTYTAGGPRRRAAAAAAAACHIYLGELDKSQKQILGQCLTTRNQCGYPNKYNPGVAKAKAHIEDITSILSCRDA
jgi:hypothetical protein